MQGAFEEAIEAIADSGLTVSFNIEQAGWYVTTISSVSGSEWSKGEAKSILDAFMLAMADATKGWAGHISNFDLKG